jgi:RNA polymerase sigma factor (sigma-70 family)
MVLFRFRKMSDAQLVRQYEAGLQMCQLNQDSEDAVQETFLKLYKAIDGFQGHSSIGTWLCRIVINVCYDQARKRQKEAEMPQELARSQSSPTLRVALEGALRRINP